jgi:hypothetical protein
MPARSITYPLSIIICFLLIISLLASIWVNQSVGITLALIFLLFGLTATSYTIINKNRKAYQQGKISLSISIKNTCLEILAILLAMVLAGLMGRYLSVVVMGNINSHPLKLLTGIGIGILVGWAIGLFIKIASSRIIRNPPGREMPVVLKK